MADFPGNHPARVQPDPQLKHDAIAALHLGGQLRHLLLDFQGCQTGPKSVVFQCNWRPK